MSDREKKRMRYAALLGALAALLCQGLPADYRAPCAALAKFAAVACGGGG